MPDPVDFSAAGAFHRPIMSAELPFGIVIRITDPAPKG
jgi:hypothetical protein